ncbi:hypothetical protein L1S34_10785 [Flavobacterium sp. K77]|uniref:Uncharacterized protein n=1 Tax=Flavobacterium turcicum TaxID=2764718 RepID=A0ABR7JH27_9FLAO|nr:MULTISPECIES: hypothetical protein [Flavobacterium]MBC5863806.1 hypothetical protein [Flavobacterium turcicum]MCF6141773.1 hypothetical protein [Flavobacterium sp. K77]NHL02246.1 hypothetical protein [Flavobacterium turcicum]
MKKNPSFIFLLLIIISFNGYSQFIIDKVDPSNSGALFRNPLLNNSDSAIIEGSQYINKEFNLAEISGTSQKLLVRYNAFTDMIEVQNEKKELFSLPKNDPFNIITIAPFSNKIKLLKYKTKERVENGYLVELYNQNQFSLYRRDRVIFQKEKEASSSYSVAIPARYVEASDEYYLSLKNETAVMMPKNKKEMLLLFPEKADEITNYLKKNDFSIKDETSVLNMVRFLAGS